MAVSSPESGVQLGKEDEQKIELVNRRLTTLQREVLSATQELSTLDSEIISTQKAKKYEESQIIELTARVEALRNEEQELVGTIRASHADLEKHRDEHGQMNQKHSSKESELGTRERTVLENEKNQSEKALKLEVAERQIEADRAEVENARNTFLDAIASVTWR